MRKYLVPLALAAALAGSAAMAVQPSPASPPPPAVPAPPVLDRDGRPVPPVRVFISPMGEPFRRADGPGEPIERWFAGADADHDGALSVTEFQADAARFFGTLDVNHDNEIAPDEISRYETQIAPEVQMGLRMRIATGGPNARPPRLRPGEGPFGMGTQALLNIPQPVISADADLNRGVSPAEFRHTAGQRFLLVDRNHDGRISHDELSPPPPEERGRRR
jgi:Ca2+-binding EF-hand superfamily protein